MRSVVIGFASLFAATLGPALLAGCGPDVPSSFPPASAASPAAAEAERPPITRALRGDPPLPSEALDGWPGLEDAPADGGAHAVYACPMHPDVTSDRPARCPQCGMRLEKRP